MLCLALIFLFLYALPKIFIDFKQMLFIQQKLGCDAIILKQEDYQKAGLYTIQKLKFSIFSTIFEYVLLMAWLIFGLIHLESFIGSFNKNPEFRDLLFLLSFFVIHTLINFPLSYYLTMVLDKKFGFSTTTPALFLQDSLKLCTPDLL